jgi:hypothetical protein
MRVLFFNHEQYVPFEYEAANVEVRLPILGSGMVTAYRDFVYQRVLRTKGHTHMNMAAMQEIDDFQPDVIVHFTTWIPERLNPRVLSYAKAKGIKVISVIFDSANELFAQEVALVHASTHLAVLVSPSDYMRYQALSQAIGQPHNTLFLIGNNVRQDFFQENPSVEKDLDVVMLGSLHGIRGVFLDYLNERLNPQGITVHKMGGNIDDSKGGAVVGATDTWLSFQDYLDTIQRAKICLNAQTVAHPLIKAGQDMDKLFTVTVKGKVFEFLSANAFCLTDDNSEARAMIPDGCVAYYDNFDDCIEKIKYYLAHTEERDAIRHAGCAWFRSSFDCYGYWKTALEAIVSGQPVPVPTHLADRLAPVLAGQAPVPLPV